MSKDTTAPKPKKAKSEKPKVEKTEAVAAPVTNDKCEIYIWRDLRIGIDFNWRFVVTFNTELYIGQNGHDGVNNALYAAVDSAIHLSGGKLKLEDIMLDPTQRRSPENINAERVKVVLDKLPSSTVWKAAEEHYEQKLKKPIRSDEIVSAIDKVLSDARRFASRAAEYGAFADAAAIDELISRGELGKLAIERLSVRPRGFPPVMMGGPMGMMMMDRWDFDDRRGRR